MSSPCGGLSLKGEWGGGEGGDCYGSEVIGVCRDGYPVKNSPGSIYYNSNLTPRFSGHISIFVLVFFVLKSHLGIAKQ